MSATAAARVTAQTLACWCGQEGWEIRFRTPRFGLLRCPSCGGFQIDPPPLQTAEESEEFYTEYYSRQSVAQILSQAGEHRSGFWNVLEQVPGLPRRGRRVADIGSGDGHLCAQLRAAGWQSVMGVEVSKSRVALARRLYPDIPFFDRPLEQTDCEPGSLDLMIMDSVIEHLPNPKETLEELRRYLAPGGYFILLTPNMDSGHFAFLGRRWTGMLAPHAHIFLFTATAFSHLLRRAGFSVVSTGSLHSDPYRPSQFLRRIGSGDFKGAIWRAHQEIGGWYGRLIGRGPMLYAVARRNL